MAQALPRFDFTRAADVREWQPAHDVAAVRATLKEPPWPHPVPPTLTDDALTLSCGELHLAHARDQ